MLAGEVRTAKRLLTTLEGLVLARLGLLTRINVTPHGHVCLHLRLAVGGVTTARLRPTSWELLATLLAVANDCSHVLATRDPSTHVVDALRLRVVRVGRLIIEHLVRVLVTTSGDVSLGARHRAFVKVVTTGLLPVAHRIVDLDIRLVILAGIHAVFVILLGVLAVCI